MGRKITLAALAGSVGAALVTGALSADRTVALLAEGYEFIPKRCRRYRSDVFETRLMLTTVFCMTGEEAAEVFYKPGRFTRKGALLQTTLRLLQDYNSVAVLDAESHHQRKRMFMSLMTPINIGRLAEATEGRLRERLGAWETMEEVVLHEEVQERRLPRAVRAGGAPFLPVLPLRWGTRAKRVRLEGAPLRQRSVGAPRPVRDQPRRPNMGRPGSVQARAVQRVGRERLRLYPPRGR